MPKPPAREVPPARPPYTPTLGGQAPHSQQFPRTRKMFDKGPEQVRGLPPPTAAPPRPATPAPMLVWLGFSHRTGGGRGWGWGLMKMMMRMAVVEVELKRMRSGGGSQ